MKFLLFSVCAIVLFLQIEEAFCQSVGINNDGSAPDNSAVLDAKAIDKGLLVPRMTSAQKNAITNPADGLMIFQIDSPVGFYYYSAGWTFVGHGMSFSELTGKPTTLSGYGITGAATTAYADNLVNSYPKIVAIKGQIGTVAANTSAWTFCGPVNTITLTKTTVVTGTIAGAFGLGDGSPVPIDFGLCYRLNSGSVVTFSPSAWQSSDISTAQQCLTACYSITLAPGNYEFGFGVRNFNSVAIDNNDWFNGWFMFSNP